MDCVIQSDSNTMREIPLLPHYTGEEREDPQNSITCPRSQIPENASATCLSTKLNALSRFLRGSCLLHASVTAREGAGAGGVL